MTPRRVLLTTDAVGGVWRYVLELANGLRARGIVPVVAVLGPSPSPAQRAEACGIALVIETGLPLDWTVEDERTLADATSELAAIARAQAVDVAQLHAPAFVGGDRWPVPVVAVAHSCVATWWKAVRGTPLPDDFCWRARATARGLAQADAVIAPTAAFAEALRTTYSIARPIAVVHNGRRAPAMARVERERAVLAVGRLWDEGKNVAALDRAAARIGAPVYAAGAGAGPGGAVAHLRNIIPLGELNESALWARYNETALLASPARYEPFGLGILEGAQAGMALVLGDIPSLRELWDGAALFVKPDDDRMLAHMLRGLLDDPEAMRVAGGRAQERARRYTVNAMVEETLALHEATLGRLAA